MKYLIFFILFGISNVSSENVFPWPETCYETCQDNEIQIVNMIEFDKDCEEEFKRFAPQAIYEDVACQWKNQVVLLNTLLEIFIFCPKIQLRFPEKIVEFFLGGEKFVKNS